MNISKLINSPAVVIWGLGQETRSLLNLLRQRGYKKPVVILDDSPEAVRDQLEEWMQPCSIHIPADERSLPQRGGVIVKSPGVSIHRPELRRFESQGFTCTDLVSLWFAENPSARTIVITGTKGKSTTASLLTHLLKAAGKSVSLAGNIGVPIFEADPAADFVVLELSSYQIAGLSGTPKISVILNLYREHLDWHGSFENYRKEKLRISTITEAAVFCAADFPYKEELSGSAEINFWGTEQNYHCKNGRLYSGSTCLELPELLPLRGTHNLNNLAAVCSVLKYLRIDPAPLLNSLSYFKALPHRLEIVLEEPWLCINDSIATIPEASIAAIQTVDTPNTTLIIGGYDRGLNWKEFADRLSEYNLFTIIGLPVTGHTVINQLNCTSKTFKVDNLEQAIRIAVRETPEAGTILLSPGAPSFGLYNNFTERGNHFASLIRSMLGTRNA